MVDCRGQQQRPWPGAVGVYDWRGPGMSQLAVLAAAGALYAVGRSLRGAEYKLDFVQNSLSDQLVPNWRDMTWINKNE